MATAVVPARDLRAQLERFTPRMIEVVAARGADEYARRQIGLAMLATRKTPALVNCDPTSVAEAMLRVCAWKLEIGITAHLVPFGRECTAIADWKGLVELMLRSGHVRDVWAEAVYSNDYFRMVRGTDPALEHQPALKERGDLLGVYAVAVLKHGRTTFEWMAVADVESIRSKARSGNSDAWKQRYDEMAKKTVVRRLAKRMPQTDALRSALGSEDERPPLEAPALYAIDGGQAHAAPALSAGPRALITTGYDGYGDDAAATSTAPAPAEPDRTSAGGQGSRVRPSPAASGAQSEAPTFIDEPARAPRPTGYRPPPGGRVVDALEQTRGLDMARRVASEPDPYEHGEPGELSDEAALALDDQRRAPGTDALREGR